MFHFSFSSNFLFDRLPFHKVLYFNMFILLRRKGAFTRVYFSTYNTMILAVLHKDVFKPHPYRFERSYSLIKACRSVILRIRWQKYGRCSVELGTNKDGVGFCLVKLSSITL